MFIYTYLQVLVKRINELLDDSKTTFTIWIWSDDLIWRRCACAPWSCCGCDAASCPWSGYGSYASLRSWGSSCSVGDCGNGIGICHHVHDACPGYSSQLGTWLRISWYRRDRPRRPPRPVGPPSPRRQSLAAYGPPTCPSPDRTWQSSPQCRTGWHHPSAHR